MGQLTDKQKELFCMRRVQALRFPESPGESYAAIYGPVGDVEALGKKMANSIPVKRRIDEIFADALAQTKAVAAEFIVMGGNDIKRKLWEMVEMKPMEASLDNPNCDVHVLRDGSLVPVPPKKMDVIKTLAQIENLMGANVNLQINLPSWHATETVIEGEKGWIEPLALE